jgi:hypothetical protein
VLSNATRYHFPLSSVAAWLVAGIVAGGGFGAWAAERQLRILERKGRVSTSISTLLTVVGGLIVFFATLFYFVNNIPTEVIASVVVFLSPMPATSFVVNSVMSSNWERRHKRQIFASVWDGMYVHPPLEQVQPNLKIRGQ